MFKPLFTRFLNHLIGQNSWARVHLLPFAGKVVRLSMPPFEADLTVLEDGGLAIAGEAASADATISVSFMAGLRILARDETASKQVSMEGETELALALAKVLQNMRWEYEEDLSKLIGDVSAEKLAEFGRRTMGEAKAQSVNVIEMLVEYWQEEQPLIAKKRHVECFVKEVDILRNDVERLAKRLEKLEQTVAAKGRE